MKKLIRIKPSLERDGDSRSGRYKKISEGLYTRPIRIGPRAVAWPEDECEAILLARISGWSDGQIRTLVEQLHEKRKHCAPSLADQFAPAAIGA